MKSTNILLKEWKNFFRSLAPGDIYNLMGAFITLCGILVTLIGAMTSQMIVLIIGIIVFLISIKTSRDRQALAESIQEPSDKQQLLNKQTSIPNCLWYLADRDAQKRKLRSAFQKHENCNTKQRPFLCLISGKAQEVHDKFKECVVVERILPKLEHGGIRGDDNIRSIENVHITNFPKNINELHNTLFDELKDVLPFCPPDDSEMKVAIRLAKENRTTVVCFNIYTQSCQPVKKVIKKGIVEFWKKWPALENYHCNYRLLVFICIRYPNQSEKSHFLTRLFKPSVQQKLKRELRQLDRELKDFAQFSAQFNVGAVVLEQLEAIKKEEVIKWLLDECSKEQSPLHLTTQQIEKAIDEIERLYKKQSHENAIPMETLVSELKKILENR